MKHNQLKSLLVVIACSMLSSSTIQTYNDYDDQNSAGVIAGIVGGVVAGVGIYGFGKYMEWWGAPTNEELKSQAYAYVKQVSDYKGMCRIAKQARKDNRVSEDSLYEAALLKRSSVYISGYISEVKKLIENLKSIAATIDRRITDINRKGSSLDRSELKSLRRALEEVRDARRAMDHLIRYLEDHRSYFKLFETEDHIAQKYARELTIMQQYAYDEYELLRGLRSALSARHSGAFGLLKAIDSLQADISSLKSALKGCGHTYVNRIACSRSLLNTLARVQEIIVSDREYTRLQLEYEAAKREEERLRLERERLANEKRIAQAKEREAYAKERDARAREEQNRLKDQENRLKAQELYDNRAQHIKQYYQ